MPSNHPPITLRPPTTTSSTQQQPPSFTPPTPQWLSGTWHVTHSTLPMWKTKRNVAITYTPLAVDPSPSPTTKLDDRVQYQTLTSAKVKTVEGIDTPSLDASGGEWDWRGKGWLRVASSHWEVLGWGDLPGEEGNQWVVTFFAKTLFTPAGIDVYSRRKEGVGGEVVERIKEALGGSADEGVKRLAREVFEVVRD